jgi:hypothetical protein
MGHASGHRAHSAGGSPMGRVYRETTPAMVARVTPRWTSGSAMHWRLLRICCGSAGIRGRSTAERAVDLGWS